MESKKIAIFVEGQTEQIFVEKLLNEMAGYNHISIQINIMGGSKTKRTIQKTKHKIVKDARLFALLYDCGNESHVVSDIRKQYFSLSNKRLLNIWTINRFI